MERRVKVETTLAEEGATLAVQALRAALEEARHVAPWVGAAASTAIEDQTCKSLSALQAPPL